MSDVPLIPTARETGDPAAEAFHETETLAIARGGGLNVLGFVFNSLVRVGVTILIGRLLGGTSVGLFYQAFAFHDLTALVLAGGFMTALTRFVAVHLAEDEPAHLRGVVRLGLALPTAAAAAVGVALWFAAPWLANSAFGDPPMVDLLRMVAIVMPGTVFTDVALAATQGWRTMKPFALIGLIFEPLFRLGLTIALLAAGKGINGAMFALIVTNYLAAGLAALALRRRMPRTPGKPLYRVRELFSFSALTWASTLLIDLFIWAQTILLGFFRPAADVGVYQVATRLVILAAVFVFPVGQAFGPRIANLYHRGEHATLRRTYATVTGWILRLAVGPFCILVLFPKPLLGIFGSDFVSGATVTALLAFGALINSSTGPTATMLIMTGRPGLVFANNSITVAINITLNLFLIPRYGVNGAAVAWLISIAVTNAIFAIEIWKSLQMHPFSFAMIKALGAGAIAIAAGLVLRSAAHGYLQVAGAMALVLAIYAGATMLFGVTAEDRLVAQTLTSRLRRKPTSNAL